MLIGRMRLAIEERALRASKDRLQLALDAALLGWWRYEPRRGLVSGDRRFKEIFDVNEDQMPIEEIKKLLHPDDAERFSADTAAAGDPADSQRPPRDYRVQRKDGEVRWVEVRRLACFEGAGRERQCASLVGTVEEITARKKRQEQDKERQERDHLLVREINHRAKNMLSVVDAIAHQTATKSPEHFIERFSERIQALSANQDLLVRDEWRGVDAGDLVRAQLAPFAELIGSRIALHDSKVRLNAASAQAIGFALHELATNAGKYGALSTDKGRIDIDWGTEGETLTMNWTERDGPPVFSPQRRGFGTIVMEQMTERSVGGVVDLDYAPSGLTWRLTCPAANALEPVASACA
jgi:PAS domain S-box-containing protein